MSHLLLETDAPWCEIRPTHASAKYVSTTFDYKVAKKPDKWTQGCIVKGRNEPCFIKYVYLVTDCTQKWGFRYSTMSYLHTHCSQVLEAVAGIKEMDKNEVADTVYKNTTKLFFKSWDAFTDFIQERIRGREQVRGTNQDGILRIFNDVSFGVKIVSVV